MVPGRDCHAPAEACGVMGADVAELIQALEQDQQAGPCDGAAAHLIEEGVGVCYRNIVGRSTRLVPVVLAGDTGSVCPSLLFG